MYKALLIILVLFSCGSSSEDSIHQALLVFGEPIPLIRISSTKKIKDEPKTEAKMQIFVKDSLLFSSKIGIEYRGAVSQMFYEKKSYGIELWDESNNGISKSVLNMSAEEDWILHGPYADKSLIRNVLAYQVSNNIGRYAPKTKFVELEINGDFRGLYVLMEKIKRGKERVNVSKNSPETSDADSISGGYLLKIDKTVGGGYSIQDDYNESNSFISNYDQSGKISSKSKIHFLYDYPKAENISELQKAYIENYMHQFEKSLASTVFSDSKLGFRKYIDEDSFVDYFLLTELFQNFDGYRISVYLQKERGEKLKMGPIWDFDLSLGSKGFCYNMNRENHNYWIFEYNKYCGDDMWVVPFWWPRLLQDKLFVEKLNFRWNALRKNEFSEKVLIQNIDIQVNYLKNTNAVERNFDRWRILNKRIEPNETKGSHDQEIVLFKNWLKQRLVWMDRELPNL
jgi:CotH kinase protein